jgi:hypothetical protein
MINSLWELMRVAVIGCAFITLGGCSLSNPTDNPFTAQPYVNGKPTVWGCSPVRMASPPLYACADNKTYTAFQLRDDRLSTETPIASK